MPDPTIEDRVVALEKQKTPIPGLSNILEMLLGAASSKKFLTMATAAGASWAAVDKFAATHPDLAVVTVASVALIISSYIVGQSIIDAASIKPK